MNTTEQLRTYARYIIKLPIGTHFSIPKGEMKKIFNSIYFMSHEILAKEVISKLLFKTSKEIYGI